MSDEIAISGYGAVLHIDDAEEARLDFLLSEQVSFLPALKSGLGLHVPKDIIEEGMQNGGQQLTYCMLIVYSIHD